MRLIKSSKLVFQCKQCANVALGSPFRAWQRQFGSWRSRGLDFTLILAKIRSKMRFFEKVFVINLKLVDFRKTVRISFSERLHTEI